MVQRWLVVRLSFTADLGRDAGTIGGSADCVIDGNVNGQGCFQYTSETSLSPVVLGIQVTPAYGHSPTWVSKRSSIVRPTSHIA